MYQATSITYNGTSSTSLGAIYCRVGNPADEDVYTSGRDIQKDSSGRNWGSKSKNYFYKVQRNPHQFTIQLGFETLTDTIARQVAKLFNQDLYLPLIPNDTNRIYYCMPTDSKVVYLGNGGYVEFEMETFDEYAYSDLITVNKDYTGNTTTTFAITTLGDVSTYPEITITPLTTGSTIKLTNLSNGSKFMQFGTDTNSNQLIANEVIVVDCENEVITTDQLALYRYDNMTTTSDYLELVSGLNTIQVDGSMLLTIKYRNKYLF